MTGMPTIIKHQVLIKIVDQDVEEIMTYVEVCDHIEAMIESENTGDNSLYTFKEIIGHQGPLTPSSPEWKGSIYNVHTLWEDNTKTWEPLGVMATDDPITCANMQWKMTY